jgi:hypothetical protein
MNVPANRILQKSKKINLKKLKSKARSKSNKCGYFSADLTRRYYLDENATVRVGVRAIPQDALKIAEERGRKENNLRQMLGSSDLKQMAGKMVGMKLGREDPSRMNFYLNPGATGISEEQCFKAPAKSMLQNLFCGAMLCAPGLGEPEESDVPREIIHTSNTNGQFGVSSLMSSVSESTDGSDCSEGEMEAEYNNFRMATAFQLH